MNKENCKYCNKKFTTYPSRIKKDKGKYCSTECYHKDRKGIRFSPNTEFKKGEQHPFYGKHRPIGVGKKISMSRKKMSKEGKLNIWCRGLKKKTDKRLTNFKNKTSFKFGHISLFKNHTEDTKKKMSNSHKRDKNPNWQGGKSFEPYGIEFNDILKEQIRKRDDYTCQECGKLQKELRRKLDVHHIDYDKKNNIPLNLITLCKRCHIKTNYGRKHWKKYFQMKMFIKELFNPQNILIFNENRQLVDVIKY